MLLLLLGALGAQAQDCGNPQWIANQAEEYVLSYVLEDATEALRRAETAYACSEPADAVVVAQLLNVEGTVALLQGRPEDATRAYATARVLAPEVWKADYGDQAHDQWLAATAGATGRLELLGAPARVEVWIDGSLVKTPTDLAAGPHLAQVGHRGQAPAFARWVDIRSGETSSLKVTLAEPTQIIGSTDGSVLQPPHKGRGLLWAGVGLAVIGSGLGAGSWALNRDPSQVVSPDYETGMKAANIGGWSLVGVGVGLGVVGAVGGKKTVGVVPTGNGLRLQGGF